MKRLFTCLLLFLLFCSGCSSSSQAGESAHDDPAPADSGDLISEAQPDDEEASQIIPDDPQIPEEPSPMPEEPEPQTPDVPDVPQGILKPDGDPWFDEFLFYEDDVYYNGLPEGSLLQSAGYINGEWKYCLTFNRTLAGEERIDEIGLAEVSFTSDSATLILHPQYIRYGTHVDPENEEEVGYQPFTGTWDNEYIDVSWNGIFIGLGPYYSFDGKDYVLGNIIVKETGLFGDVLLVRP